MNTLMGKPPNKLFRNASAAIMTSLIGLFLICHIIKYPDIINADSILTSNNPPINIVSNAEGHIDEILVDDKSYVSKDEVIMTIQNPAKLKDVQTMQIFLGVFNSFDLNGLDTLTVPQNLILGSIQDSYVKLSQDIEEYKSIIL